MSSKSAYSRANFLRQDEERHKLVHRMSKFQNTLAVSSSANRAASARLQSEGATRASHPAIRTSQKIAESSQSQAAAAAAVDALPATDAPLSAQPEAQESEQEQNQAAAQ